MQILIKSPPRSSLLCVRCLGQEPASCCCRRFSQFHHHHHHNQTLHPFLSSPKPKSYHYCFLGTRCRFNTRRDLLPPAPSSPSLLDFPHQQKRTKRTPHCRPSDRKNLNHAKMSEGKVAPENPVVAEAHQVDTFRE